MAEVARSEMMDGVVGEASSPIDMGERRSLSSDSLRTVSWRLLEPLGMPRGPAASILWTFLWCFLMSDLRVNPSGQPWNFGGGCLSVQSIYRIRYPSSRVSERAFVVWYLAEMFLPRNMSLHV